MLVFEWNFLGLSSETKPLNNEKVINGSTFYECDTSSFFIYYNGEWYKQTFVTDDGINVYLYKFLMRKMFKNAFDTNISKTHVYNPETSSNITFTSVLPSNITEMEMYGDSVQDGTPIPDTPVNVQTVTGEQTVTISGKNLFNINTLAKGSITVTDGVATGTTGQFYTEFRDGITLPRIAPVMSITATAYRDGESSSGNGIAFIAYYTDETYENVVVFPNSTTTPTTLTGTTDSSKTLDHIGIVYGSGSSNVWHISNVQVEVGSATAYEPYQGADYTVDLGSIELCKIGDYQDYIYKTGNDWYVHRAVEKVTLTGNADETWSGGNNNVYFFHTISDAYQPDNRGTVASILCNYYEANTYNRVASTTIDYGVAIDSNNAGRLAIRNKDCANVIAFKTWLASNNTTVYYPLATPTDTKITDTELISSLDSIMSYTFPAGLNYITVSAATLPALLKLTIIEKE